jgi:beta-aspartyl-peptidase (threonine type)
MWSIAIHGGAGVISKDLPNDEKELYYESLKSALRIGLDILQKKGHSTEAVESVIRFLEDCELFNAGKGSVFTRTQKHEMDASIMEGNTLKCGAVSAITGIKNPIILARKIMTDTEHVHLTGAGAENYANEINIERAPPEYFYTERRYKQWESAQKENIVTLDHSDNKTENIKGTVGCVALDVFGHLVAGTSTGGMTNKRPGRVGDSPIIGAGTYANHLCAISATGNGEEFIRHVVSHDVAKLMEYKEISLNEAAELVIHKKLKKGDGGLIGVDHKGNIALVFNSHGMFRGAAKSDGLFEVKIWEDL